MKICAFVDQAISYETKDGVDCVLYQEGITHFVWVLMGGMEREKSARSGREVSDRCYGLGPENLVTVIGEVSGLLGFKGGDVQG